MHKLAIYDMDRTITRSGTYTPFLIHVARAQAPWRLLLLPVALLFMLAYASHIISRTRLKELNLGLLVGKRFDARMMQPIIDDFAKKTVETNSYAEALAQVEADRKAGCRLVLATASYHLYVDAIARRLGFDDVVATDLVRDDAGRIRARICGENCYDTAKLRKIETWMRTEGLERGGCEIRAYSDHISDLPLLEFADSPHATNPSAALRSEAFKRGWPVHDWT